MSEPTPPGTVPVDRPSPLKTLALVLGPAMAAVSGILTFLVSFGMVNQATADTINSVGGAIVTGVTGSIATTGGMPVWAAVVSALVAAGGAVVTTLIHTALAKRKVTPVEDPRDNDGTRLVRIDSPLLARGGGFAQSHTVSDSGSTVNVGWHPSPSRRQPTRENPAPPYGRHDREEDNR